MKSGPWYTKTYILCLILCISSIYLTNCYDLDLWKKIVITIVLTYLPSYLDGSSRTVEGRAWVGL